MGASPLNAATFIQLGLTKDKWLQITVPLIQAFLDDPTLLDDEQEDFLERFWFYCDWYHSLN